jgi:RNA polymerase sigma-70 factor (ECF subfamily)
MSETEQDWGDGTGDLVARVAGGDRAALRQLFSEQVDAVYAYVFYRVGGDPSLAEDATQETFARALDRAADYDPARGSVRAWLLTTSRNAVRDILRAHHRGNELAARWEQIDGTLAQIFAALDREPLSDEMIERGETRDLVNMAFANLPEKYRAVLAARYVEGDSVADLAGRHNLTDAAAKSLLARARRAFRETFAALAEAWVEV